MRVAVDHLRQQADFRHGFAHMFSNLFAAHAWIERDQRFGDDFTDRHARIEARERILEDDLHVLAQAPHGFKWQGCELVTEPSDRARGGFDQLQDGAAKRGFSTSRFANDAQSLAGCDIETDTINGFERRDRGIEQTACSYRKMNFEVVYLKESIGHAEAAQWQATERVAVRCSSGGC